MLDTIIRIFLRSFSKPVCAQNDCSIGGTDKPPELSQIACIIDNIFQYIFPAGVLIAVIMIIVGGYMWIVSGGDPARKLQAQGTLTWAVIGLIVLFLVRALLKAITDFVVV